MLKKLSKLIYDNVFKDTIYKLNQVEKKLEKIEKKLDEQVEKKLEKIEKKLDEIIGDGK